MQVLVVWEQSLGLGTVEVVVPNADKSEDDGKVVLKLGGLEVLVHLVSTGEELVEVVETNVDSNGEADSRPKGVTAADPVPELEHVLLIDTKGSYTLSVGGEGHKVLGNVRLLGKSDCVWERLYSRP